MFPAAVIPCSSDEEVEDELKMWNGSAEVGPRTQDGLPGSPKPDGDPPDLYTGGPEAGGVQVVVRAEEALIVCLVLVLWVGAIALFFNRWGKIRMLEPYQPKFHEEHRPSCPMADISAVRHEQHRTSFSKFNMNWMEVERAACRNQTPRPRQNSVFVGSTLTVKLNPPPRKTKSAMDIQSLLNHEAGPALTSRSMLPMLSVEKKWLPAPVPPLASRPSSTGQLGGTRRPSELEERRRSGEWSGRRPSFAASDWLPLPLPCAAQAPRDRRPSCSGECLGPPSLRRPSFAASDWLSLPAPTRERRPSFNNVIAQVTAERRPSSAMLRITNV